METIEDAHRVTADLALALFRELFPHDETLSRPPSQRFSSDRQPKREHRFAHVESPAGVEVGDLLFVIEPDSEKRVYGWDVFSNCTAREALRQRGGSFVVVTAKRGTTMIEAVPAIAPHGGIDTDLTRLGEPWMGNSEPTRMKVPSARSIANLGKPEELRARIMADARFPQWQAAYAAAKEQEQRKAAEARVEQEARKTREKPLKDAAAHVNALVGSEIITGGWVSKEYAPRIASKWLAEGDRLRVHLAGLAALGRLTAEEHREALGHLDTLGLATDTTEGEQ
ncbi:hypothetical protein [Streptomyces sp. S1D4-20]|uniref:hypothetical protein n=1 Tax=Streptomyces sp. S1D4-20 TaxID=2594462 RepID=UPI001161D26E|nr:hypothetical protein [Streptomyces sp. S1D4-20]QDN54070.1 hypothetical protein FNV67_00375 [Streptomyces sp. S1D4-20]